MTSIISKYKKEIERETLSEITVLTDHIKVKEIFIEEKRITISIQKWTIGD